MPRATYGPTKVPTAVNRPIFKIGIGRYPSPRSPKTVLIFERQSNGASERDPGEAQPSPRDRDTRSGHQAPPHSRPADLAGGARQNGYVERLIGSVRRECLHRVLIFGEAHLLRILSSYAA